MHYYYKSAYHPKPQRRALHVIARVLFGLLLAAGFLLVLHNDGELAMAGLLH